MTARIANTSYETDKMPPITSSPLPAYQNIFTMVVTAKEVKIKFAGVEEAPLS